MNDLESSLNQNFLNISNHVSRIYLLAEIKNSDSINNAIKEYLEAKILVNYAKKKRLLQENVKIFFTEEEKSGSKEVDKEWYFFISESLINETCFNILNSNNIGDELEKLYKAMTRKGE